MCTLDERILEHLEEDSWSTPRFMSKKFRFNASQGRVEERCRKLTQAGLIAPIYEETNLYAITGEGRQYLEGELDAAHQPLPYRTQLRR